MAAKKMMVAGKGKTKDLVSPPSTLAEIRSVPPVPGIQAALQVFVQKVSTMTAPAIIADTVRSIKTWQTALESIERMLKERIQQLVMEQGEVTTEKGSRQLTHSGWLLEIRPHRTGLDGKKLEALLRAKSMSVESAMDPTITYKPNEGKIQSLVAAGTLTADETEACKYDLTWAVQTPKLIQNGEVQINE